MVLKNLFRRKGRTLLTVLGISIGVAAIVGLGTMANGLEAGYDSLLKGSKSDLVLSQPNSIDISYSSVDEEVGPQLAEMPEVDDVSGMIQGFVQAEGIPYFFVFGYPSDSFVLSRFKILEGVELESREAQRARGVPILLGAVAAETLEKSAGDTLRLTDSVYRIIGVYETGDPFEDSGAVLGMPEAQDLLGKPRQVSLFYIKLRDPELKQRFADRVARRWPDLELGTTDDFADKQLMGDVLQGYVWGIAGIAIVIGGVGMMNAQLMSVYERTSEIGVLRALGWSRGRVLRMILGESILVGLLGGAVGVFLGWLSLTALSGAALFGASAGDISAGLLLQAFITVGVLGVVGGLYPAWRASRMQPVEALRYEGGAYGGDVRRLPRGGMAVQSLWQRIGRTSLTLGAIGLTVGAIMALEGVVRGATDSFTDMATGANVEIMVRQADIADTSLSALDERTGDRIGSLPEVQHVSGIVFAAVGLPESGGFFLMQGFSPNEYAIRRFVMVEGTQIQTNRQIMLGRVIAEALNKDVGETLDLGGSRFKVVGIYESGIGWEEAGGVVSLRDAQSIAGRPRKVTMYAVKVTDPSLAPEVVDRINAEIPEAHAALAGEFVEQLPDMQATDGLLGGISFLAILVGGVGVLNTMLMAVLERTREIGVLRTMGWRRRSILSLILRESVVLGFIGGLAGVVIAFVLVFLLGQIPFVGSALAARWNLDIFIRAFVVALTLGLLGGLYPAFRATRLEPVEALRYE